MSTTHYTSNLLSDALERAYSRSLIDPSQNQPLQLGKATRTLGRALGRAAVASGRFISNVINAQAEARASAMRYTRTPW